MRIAEVEKITGQSLNGKKFTFNPVNKDKIARENSMPAIDT